MSGWFAVSRGITSHPLFKGKPDRLAVWMWLLDNAVWKDTTHDVKGHTVEVPRGSVCVSERHISKECGVGYQVVRTAIKRFTTEHMVNTKVTHGKNVITLCNYSKYQDLEKPYNATLTQPQRNANAQKEQGNKVTKEQKEDSLSPSAPKKPSGSRLSQDWFLPKSWGDYGIEKGATPELIRTESENFKDYWISVAGAKARKADWEATWRGWIRRAIANSPKQKPHLKTINGGRNDQALNNSADQRSDPALEQIARLTRLDEASSHGGI